MLTYIECLKLNYPNIKCTYYSGDGSDYNSIEWISGDPLPTQEELDVLILDKCKEEMWTNIQAKREQVRASGVLVGENWFHSDDTSRIQQIALVMLGSNMPTGIMWKTMSGSFVEMTPTLAGQIFFASITKEQIIYGVAEGHKAAMLSSENPELYDYSTGWPAGYAE